MLLSDDSRLTSTRVCPMHRLFPSLSLSEVKPCLLGVPQTGFLPSCLLAATITPIGALPLLSNGENVTLFLPLPIHHPSVP